MSQDNVNASSDDDGIDRREFVRRAAMATAAAAAVGPTLLRSGAASASTAPGSVLDRPASECPIDTVVVLMMENRSFDHYLGWLGTDGAYLDEGRRRWGSQFAVEAKNQVRYRNAAGKFEATEALVERPDDPNPYRLCKGPAPGHGWTTGRRQRDAGFLASGTGNNQNAIGYYTAEDVPVHAALARRFTVLDHHFSSVMGPTFPNRQYFHSAESEGRKKDPGPLRAGIFDGTTIWDKLTAAGVSCGYYYTDNPASFLVYGDRMQPLIRSLDRYFEDCATGSLPQFVFIAPSFVGEYRTDNHPRACINVGERFVLEVFGAFVQSTHWQRARSTPTTSDKPGSASRRSSRRRTRPRTSSTQPSTTTPRCCVSSNGGSSAPQRTAPVDRARAGISQRGTATRTTTAEACGRPIRIPTWT